jgi:hypothetical protein
MTTNEAQFHEEKDLLFMHDYLRLPERFKGYSAGTQIHPLQIQSIVKQIDL